MKEANRTGGNLQPPSVSIHKASLFKLEGSLSVLSLEFIDLVWGEKKSFGNIVSSHVSVYVNKIARIPCKTTQAATACVSNSRCFGLGHPPLRAGCTAV